MLNEQLKRQIVLEAEEYNNQFKHATGFREPAFFDGATKYAELWQAAEAKAERYEKALKEILALPKPWNENPFSDMAIRIATEALTP